MSGFLIGLSVRLVALFAVAVMLLCVAQWAEKRGGRK